MAFKDAAITAIYGALRWYAGSGVFDRVTQMVAEMMNADLTGAEKREKVVQWAKEEFAFIRGNLVRAIIEVYLLKQTA